MNILDPNEPYAGPAFGDEDTVAVLDARSGDELFRKPELWEMCNATGAESADLMTHLEDIFRCREIYLAEWTRRADHAAHGNAHYRYRSPPDDILCMWSSRENSLMRAVCRYRKLHGKPYTFFIRHKKGMGILSQGVIKRSWKEIPEPFVFNLAPPSPLRDLSPLERMLTAKKRPPVFQTPEQVFESWVSVYGKSVGYIRKAPTGGFSADIDCFMDCLGGNMPAVPKIDEVKYGKAIRWTSTINEAARLIELLRRTYEKLRDVTYALKTLRKTGERFEAKPKRKNPGSNPSSNPVIQTALPSGDLIKNHRNQMMLVVQAASEIIDKTAASLPDSFHYTKPSP